MCVFVFGWRFYLKKMFSAAPILMGNLTTAKGVRTFSKTWNYEICALHFVHCSFQFCLTLSQVIYVKTQPSSWYSTFSQIQIFHTRNSTRDVCSFLFVHCTLKHTGLLSQYLISWQIDPLSFLNDVTISRLYSAEMHKLYLCMLRLKDFSCCFGTSSNVVITMHI